MALKRKLCREMDEGHSGSTAVIHAAWKCHFYSFITGLQVSRPRIAAGLSTVSSVSYSFVRFYQWENLGKERKDNTSFVTIICESTII